MADRIKIKTSDDVVSICSEIFHKIQNGELDSASRIFDYIHEHVDATFEQYSFIEADAYSSYIIHCENSKLIPISGYKRRT